MLFKGMKCGTQSGPKMKGEFDGEGEETAKLLYQNDFQIITPLPTPAPQPNIESHLSNLQIFETTYGTDLKNGLTRNIVESRQKLHGKNIFNLPSSSVFGIFRSWLSPEIGLILSKFIEQFMEPLIGLLFVSAAVSLILGQVENAVSISIAVFIVGTVGFIQEYRTEKSLEALKKLAPPRCRVIRDAGRIWEILAEELVVGDIVELAMGDRIPADVTLITANDLQVDESILTGENYPVQKKGFNQSSSKESQVFMGTLVRQGRARGLVTAIGLKTEFGRLARLMNETEERRSPLQIRLDHLGNQLTIYSIGIILIISLIGFFWQKKNFIETFTVAVSLAVAAIPEGLPIVATITLALGVLRLSKRGVVVKKLPAVEALGSMSVFCADKTGTLTLNEMTVDAVYSTETSGHVDLNDCDFWKTCPELAQVAWLCNDANLTMNGNESRWQGNSTDIALKKMISRTCESPCGKIIESIPFNSTTKMMAVKVQYEDLNEEWLVKGAADFLMQRGPQDEKLLIALEELNRKGYRVIALGKSVVNDQNTIDEVRLIGLAGLIDPCRSGMQEMVTSLHNARIQTIMITGDSKESATEVGKKIGWLRDNGASIISGDEMLRGSDAAQQCGSLRGYLNDLAIVYRATPEQKLHLVKLLQSIDHVVSMTGDGVNDAPALKLADIGIAMGGSNGSDVAREAANIIMSEDELTRIVEGIAEGRAIFRNIRHFVRFQLGVSLAALGLMSFTSILQLNAPLTALQILLINIIMDGPPAQSLGVEPTTPASIKSLLSLPPVESNARILPRGMIIQTVIMAVGMIICTFLGYPIGKHFKMDTPVLLTYATFVSCTIAYALTCRSSTRSVLFSLPSGGPFSNSFLNLSLALTGVMLLITCYVEFFRGSVIPALTPKQWILPGLSMVSLVILDEIVKIWGRFLPQLTFKRIGFISSQHKAVSSSSSSEII